MSDDRWQFAAPPATPRAPQVVLLALSAGPLRDAAAVGRDLARAGLDLRVIPRRLDPGWFDGWRAGSLRAVAADDLGPALSALDAADHLLLIAAAPAAPTDLGYLQAAWDAARDAAARGASVVLDVHAARYCAAAALPPPGPLAVDAEVRLVFETSADGDDRPHALHTRGLRKFGAPDLVALCGGADAPVVGAVLRRLADAAARGLDLALPRHAVRLDERTTWYAVADEHGLADLLQLNNAARVLVDERGHDLVGVRARLEAG